MVVWPASGHPRSCLKKDIKHSCPKLAAITICLGSSTNVNGIELNSHRIRSQLCVFRQNRKREKRFWWHPWLPVNIVEFSLCPFSACRNNQKKIMISMMHARKKSSVYCWFFPARPSQLSKIDIDENCEARESSIDSKSQSEKPWLLLWTLPRARSVCSSTSAVHTPLVSLHCFLWKYLLDLSYRSENIFAHRQLVKIAAQKFMSMEITFSRILWLEARQQCSRSRGRIFQLSSAVEGWLQRKKLFPYYESIFEPFLRSTRSFASGKTNWLAKWFDVAEKVGVL